MKRVVKRTFIFCIFQQDFCLDFCSVLQEILDLINDQTKTAYSRLHLAPVYSEGCGTGTIAGQQVRVRPPYIQKMT